MSHPALTSPRLLALLLCVGAGCATVRPETAPQFKTYASVGDRPYPIVSSNLDGDGIASGRVEPERPGREPGIIAGRVVDPRGRPIAGAQVRLASDGAPRGRLNAAETDPSGGFTLRGLRPGSSYTLIVESRDGDAVYTRRVEADAPDERVRITLGADDSEVPTYANTPRPSVTRASNVRKGPSPNEPEITFDSRPRINADDVDPPPAHAADSPDDRASGRDPVEEQPPAVTTRGAHPAGAWRPSGSSRIADESDSDGPLAEADPAPRRGRPEPRTTARRADQFDDDEALPPAIERPEPRPGPSPVLTDPPRSSTTMTHVRPEPASITPRPRPRPAADPAGWADGPAPAAQPPAIEPSTRPIHRAPPVLDFSDRSPRSAAPASLPDPDPIPDQPLPAPASQTPADSPAPRVEPQQPAPLPAAESEAPPPAAPEPTPTPAPDVPSEPAAPVVPEPRPEGLPDLPPSTPAPALEPASDSAPPEPSPVATPPEPTSAEPAKPEEAPKSAEATEVPSDEETANLDPRRRIRWGQLVVQDRGREGARGTIEPEARRASAIVSGAKAGHPETAESERSTARAEAPAPRRGEVVCKLDPTAKQIVALQAPDILGRDVNLADLDSDLILLDFWGTWCAPCRDAIPHLIELQKQYGPRKLRVLGIAYEQTPIERRAALVAETGRKLGVNYPLLLGLSDTPCPIRDALRIQVYPTMILLDRQGRILWRQEGATPQNLARLDRAIAIALQEKPDGGAVRR